MTFAARLQDHRGALRCAPFVVIGLALLAARLPLAQHHPALALTLLLWLAADSLLLACVATTESRRPGAGQIVARLAGACAIVTLAAPPPLQAVLRATPVVLAAMGLAVLAHLALAASRAVRGWHDSQGVARWERVAGQFLPLPLVRFARLELTVLHMALLRWGGPADVPPGARAFAYHRHLTPMAATLLALSAIEVAVYHVFLGHWSRWAAVAMFVLSDLGLVYLVGLVKSFRFRPILLDSDGLRVRAGFLIDVAVPIERIAQVTMAIDGAEIRDPATLNAALLAWPNVVVHLNAPLPHGPAWRRRMCQRVAFRLDDPEPLVRLLRWRLNQP